MPLSRRHAASVASRAFAGGGASLPATERAIFGTRFGWDFAGVRLHAGPDGAAACDRIDARAFTAGRDIAFGRDAYAPGTHEGRRLLAHELAHVVQQSRGGGVPPPAGDAALEGDADRAAAAALAGGAANVAGASGVGIAREPNDAPKKPQPDPDAAFHYVPAPQGSVPPTPAWTYVPEHPPIRFPPLYRLRPPPTLTLWDPKDARSVPIDPSGVRYLSLGDASGKSPGDPQASTPTGGLIPGNAQVQDKGDFGLTYNLSHPVYGGGGFAPGFGIAAGVADLGHDVGLELGATGGAPGGTSTAAAIVPHIAWAPKETHLNVGAFGTLGVTGGTSPPGRTDANPQAGGTLIVERPIGDRNSPVLLPSLQGNLGYARFAPVGDAFASDAVTTGLAGNLQWNPSYYTAADGTLSKTAKDTLFAEAALGYMHGGRYGGPAGSTAAATTGAFNLGYQHNFRLDNGHLIVSPMLWAGGGGGSASPWAFTAGGGLGISFSPWDKAP
jgi:hypothetical protein